MGYFLYGDYLTVVYHESVNIIFGVMINYEQMYLQKVQGNNCKHGHSQLEENEVSVGPYVQNLDDLIQPCY